MKHKIKQYENGRGLWCENCGAYLGPDAKNVEERAATEMCDCVTLEMVVAAQKMYEVANEPTECEDETPCICGYYGRACRRMRKGESGSCSMLCTHCPIDKIIDMAKRKRI